MYRQQSIYPFFIKFLCVSVQRRKMDQVKSVIPFLMIPVINAKTPFRYSLMYYGRKLITIIQPLTLHDSELEIKVTLVHRSDSSHLLMLNQT